MMINRLRAKLSSIRPADIMLGSIGLLILGGLYLYWRNGNPEMTKAGIWAGTVSAALFAVFGLRLVGSWMSEWRAAPKEKPSITEPVRTSETVKVFFACLAAEAAALVLVYVFRVAAGYTEPFFDSLSLWERLDSQHYIDIARDWYLSEGERGRILQLVFLPGYPILIRLFHLAINDWLAAAFCASIIPFCFGAVMLYRLARLDFSHAGALRAVKYTLILPGAFFFAAPMSEGLFFLLSVTCLYCVRRKLWLFAGVIGGLASFTRSLGLVLLAPAVYEFVTDIIAQSGAEKNRSLVSRRVGQAVALLLIPAGFAVYCLINYTVSGEPFQFLVYQSENWNQRLGLFFHTAAYQTEYALEETYGDTGSLLGLWLPNLSYLYGALIIMIFAVRRLKPVYSMYFLAYYVIAIGATWLLSAPRYLVACAALSLGLSGISEDRCVDDTVSVILTAAYTFYAMCMANRWQVW